MTGDEHVVVEQGIPDEDKNETQSDEDRGHPCNVNPFPSVKCDRNCNRNQCGYATNVEKRFEVNVSEIHFVDERLLSPRTDVCFTIFEMPHSALRVHSVVIRACGLVGDSPKCTAVRQPKSNPVAETARRDPGSERPTVRLNAEFPLTFKRTKKQCSNK